MQKLLSLLAVVSITQALPMFNSVNVPITELPISVRAHADSDSVNVRCKDNKEYYTTSTILNRNISITINDTKKFDIMDSSFMEYFSDSYNYLHNFTFNGLVVLEYNIITSCRYTCSMFINGDFTNSRFVVEYINTNFNVGSNLHVMCSSSGCRWANFYCKTFHQHDEL